eukprot:10386838-Karenia_brevis.AAC.1
MFPGLFVHLGYPVAHPDIYREELQPVFDQLMREFDDETIRKNAELARGKREQAFVDEIGFQWQEDVDWWEEQARARRERLEQEERESWADASHYDWVDAETRSEGSVEFS